MNKKILQTCPYCKASLLQNDETCCRMQAEEKLMDILKNTLKQPNKAFLTRLNTIFSKKAKHEEKARQPEAFSLSEIIDKFIIIALKNEYLDGERLTQNKNDYHMVEGIIKQKLNSYEINNLQLFVSLCTELWVVNAEIFCVNDVCGSNQDDSIVAAAARRMIDMIKERNRIKHAIAKELKEMMFETKQFQKA